jgi:hypothetical protein
LFFSRGTTRCIRPSHANLRLVQRRLRLKRPAKGQSRARRASVMRPPLEEQVPLSTQSARRPAANECPPGVISRHWRTVRGGHRADIASGPLWAIPMSRRRFPLLILSGNHECWVAPTKCSPGGLRMYGHLHELPRRLVEASATARCRLSHDHRPGHAEYNDIERAAYGRTATLVAWKFHSGPTPPTCV